MDDIYSGKILSYAGNISRLGTLADAHATGEAHSRICGSKIKVWIKTDGQTVTDFAHDVKACALGQASSSILAANIIGANIDEIRKASHDMLAMLQDQGEGPTGRFEEMRCLKPVKDYKARHASTMLTFDAVLAALGHDTPKA